MTYFFIISIIFTLICCLICCSAPIVSKIIGTYYFLPMVLGLILIGAVAYMIYSSKRAALEDKINTIIYANKPHEMIMPKVPVPFAVDVHLINKEVNTAVKTCKRQIESLVQECAPIDSQLNELLACKDWSCNPREKLAYLDKHASELKELKSKRDSICDRINSCKIKLLNEDANISHSIQNAFDTILQSKKCALMQVSNQTFICKYKPKELSLFIFKCEPVILHYKNFYFCLFSNVILVFDVNGVFSVALDPSALSIKVNREKADLHIRNNVVQSHPYIAEDSKCIRRGNTRRTWLHVRRDGAPDLRYSHNPQIEYRTDTYEYVVLNISIADSVLVLMASSQRVALAFETMISRYIRHCIKMHDPIPELLLLLKTLRNDGDSQICSLVEECTVKSKSRGYFCEVVTFDCCWETEKMRFGRCN